MFVLYLYVASLATLLFGHPTTPLNTRDVQPSLMEPAARRQTNASLLTHVRTNSKSDVSNTESLPPPPLSPSPSPSLSPSLSAPHNDSLRLPTSLRPVEYFIKIFPVPLRNQSFRGYFEVDLEVMEPTSVVHLNIDSLNIDIGSIIVSQTGSRGKEIVNVMDYSLYPEKQIGSFTLEKILTKGEIVRFSSLYSGSLVNSSFGLNQILYKEQDGRERRVLATYLQPIGARRVFPCMDEPNLKAKFTLHIGKWKGNTVLSNMEVNRTSFTQNGSYSWTEFKKSLPMSTYLVAFVISEFKTRSPNHRVVKVWSRKSQLGNSVYASTLGSKVLKWYESFLGVKYPLAKLDLVTFPSYAVPGMENFGLITSEENSLLTNGQLNRREWVATVTAHEIAHQWAGNLVTPNWWTEYWLSEGFATYFAARALDEVEPSLEAMKRMVTKDTFLVLRQDEGDGSAPLVEKYFDPRIESAKSYNIYFKGASTVRMLESILGDKTFIIGLQNYFRLFQFHSASESDLYTALSSVFQSQSSRSSSNPPLPTSLHQIMKSWTKEKGYPLISVKRHPEGGISVTQEMFTKKTSPLKPAPTEPSALWWVPLSFATSRDPNFNKTHPRAWLRPSNASLLLNGVGKQDSWVILNVQKTSYSRVNYDRGLWDGIANQLSLDHTVVHDINRAQLFDDAFYLFNTGHHAIDIPMSLLSYVAKERSYHPLISAFYYLNSIEIVMRGNEHYPLFKEFCLSFISPLLRAGFGPSHMEIQRYDLVTSWACKLRDSQCLKVARTLFDSFKRNGDISVLPEEATESILCSVLEEGSQPDWDFVYQRLVQGFDAPEEQQQHKRIYINALACSKNETTIRKYLSMIEAPSSKVSPDDARSMYDSLARSLLWNEFAWKYFSDNLDLIDKRFDGLPLPFVSTPYDLQQLKFVLESQFPNATSEQEENIALVVEDSEKHAKRNSRIIQSLSRWLLARHTIITT